MKCSKFFLATICLSIFIISACSNDNEENEEQQEASFFETHDKRNFKMGFTSWPYAPTVEAVEMTNSFIETKGDIYSEHIDSEIPWSAWLEDTELPSIFTEMIDSRVARRTTQNKLAMSVSLLNISRTDLMPDFKGDVPDYERLDDNHIIEAYHKHIDYLIERLSPDYLVIAIEVDGLLKHAPEKWEAYKSLIAKVKSRIKNDHSTLPISESVMLHNFYRPDWGDEPAVISEITDYLNSMDFAAISFYPFLKGLKNKNEFQAAFDFLHREVLAPIAFVETGHLSEDLSVPAFDLFIAGNQSEQEEYLQTLLINAQQQNYEYVIWWTHRDYEPLWQTFPEDLKDVGSLWLSNGIIDEDGTEKQAFSSWEQALSK